MNTEKCKHDFREVTLSDKGNTIQKKVKQCILCKRIKHIVNGREVVIENFLVKDLQLSVSGKVMDKDQKKAMMESNDVYNMV